MFQRVNLAKMSRATTGAGKRRQLLSRYNTNKEIKRFDGLDSTIEGDQVYFHQNWMPT